MVAETAHKGRQRPTSQEAGGYPVNDKLVLPVGILVLVLAALYPYATAIVCMIGATVWWINEDLGKKEK